MLLTVENGSAQGTSLTLERGRPVTIGSAQGATLRLEGPGIAGEHAVIKALKGEGFGVKTLASGVLLNGAEIRAAPIAEGDVLEVAGVRLRCGPSRGKAADMLGGYRLRKVIGKGGMGTVYQAEQVSLNREVALKVLFEELTADPMFVGSFVAEARAAARLHHPNVVQVFDVDHDEDTYFYPMELMVESVEQVVRREGKLDPDIATAIIADAARGLAYAESLNIVHRDIKPDNIMLDRHGTAKLCDLGLAQTGEGTHEGKVAGTPHFMAPEQALRRPTDNRTDVYSLGCTFYRMLTGHTPFRGSTIKEILKAQIKEEPEPPHKHDPEIPADLSPIVMRMLEKDPDDRYQSATELLEDLEAWASPPPRKGLLIGGAVALIALVILVIVLLNKDRETIETVIDNTDLNVVQQNEKLREEQRQNSAELARLRVMSSSRVDGELAAALDAMITAHPDTRAAETAIEQATGIRARLAADERARQRRQQALDAAVATLEQDTSTALTAGHWHRALELLELAAVPESLRDDPALLRARDTLRTALGTEATKRITALATRLRRAIEDNSLDRLPPAIDALAAVMYGDGAWPAVVIAERPPLDALLSKGRTAISHLETAHSQALIAAAWERHDAALNRARPQLTDLDWGQAGAILTAAGAEFADTPAAQRIEATAAWLRAAQSFQDAFVARAAQGDMLLARPDGTLAPAEQFQPTGPDRGFTVQTGTRSRPRLELIPLDTIDLDRWLELTATVRGADPALRTAFLTALLLRRTLNDAGTYLNTIRSDDDGTGSGSAGYSPNLLPLEELLGSCGKVANPPPWMPTLCGELQAVRRLMMGFKAISKQRNRAAAAHLRGVLEDHPHTMVVAILR